MVVEKSRSVANDSHFPLNPLVLNKRRALRFAH